MSPTNILENKPLEEMFMEIVKGGVKENIPALSKQFASCREIHEYVRPPIMTENGSFALGSKDSWISSTELIVQDFTWLLSLEHNRFWSELIFHKESLDGLVSFLQEAYPFYSLDLLPSDYDITHLYHKTCYLAFLLINRILTRCESERNWISEEAYSKLLYDNYIISIPMILDICVIYGQSNQKEIRCLLDYIFTVQPFYKEDLHKMVTNIKCVFDGIRERLGSGSEFGGVAKLVDRREELSATELEDILLYLLDVSISLAAFADLCPLAAVFMHQHRLEITLATFYTNFMPDVAHHIKRLCQDDSLIGSYISTVLKMNQIRHHIIQLFYNCLMVSFNTSLHLWKWTEEEIKEESEGRLDILSECLGEKAFMKDFHRRYPIDMLIKQLVLLSSELDNVKIKFILDSLPSLMWNPMERANVKYGVSRVTNSRTKNSVGLYNGSLTAMGSGSQSHSSMPIISGSASSSKDQDKPGSSAPVEDSIRELKEIFPYLGDGFLLRCFEYYGNSRSTVINAILEKTLPVELSSLDPDLPIIPPDPDEGRPLLNRVNVFDNDEFDIMTRDKVDTSKILFGKKRDPYRNLSEMLDDKCHILSMKENDFYSKLGNIPVDEELDYDDEYDDSYDSVPVPLEEVGDSDRRSFVTPRILEETRGWRKNKSEELEDEDDYDVEEEETVANSSKDFLPFVENPEIIRERWQQKKMGRHNQSNFQYTGKPKGQGQDEKVLYNRHKKNVNKSNAANHNRRKQAQNKRMHGMVPS